MNNTIIKSLQFLIVGLLGFTLLWGVVAVVSSPTDLGFKIATFVQLLLPFGIILLIVRKMRKDPPAVSATIPPMSGTGDVTEKGHTAKFLTKITHAVGLVLLAFACVLFIMILVDLTDPSGAGGFLILPSLLIFVVGNMLRRLNWE